MRPWAGAMPGLHARSEGVAHHSGGAGNRTAHETRGSAATSAALTATIGSFHLASDVPSDPTGRDHSSKGRWRSARMTVGSHGTPTLARASVSGRCDVVVHAVPSLTIR